MANKLRMDLELDSKGYVQGAQEASHSTKDLNQETQDYIKSFGSLKKQLASAKKDAQNLAGAFASLSKTEKESEFGKEIASQLDEAIRKAAELQDSMGDVNEQIKNMASDTGDLDAFREVLDLAKSATVGLTGAMTELTGSEAEAAKLLKTLTTITAGYNAAIKITSILQANSKTMTALVNNGVISLTTATKIQTVATKALGTAMKALPYVAIAAGVISLTKSIYNYATAAESTEEKEKRLADEEEKRQKKLNAIKQAQEAYTNTMNSTFGQLMTKYAQLSAEWKKLSSEHEKQQWIKNNKTELNNLGIAVNSVKDAEDAFDKNRSKIVESFKKRAEAAAIAARMTALYTRSLELESEYIDRYNSIKYRAGDKDRRSGHTLDENGETYNNGTAIYNKLSGAYELTAKGAAEANKQLTQTDSILVELNEDFKKNNTEIDKFDKRLQNLSTTTINTNTTNTTTDKPVKVEVKPEIPKSNLQKLKDELKELKAKLEFALDDESVEQVWSDIRAKEKEIENEEIRLKIKAVPEFDSSTIDKDINNIFNKLSTKTKTYDFSFLPDNFRDQADDALDRLNALEDAREHFQEKINESNNAESIAKYSAALASTDAEYIKLTNDVQKFNDVSSQIKERTVEIENFKNAISSVSTVVGSIDSVVSAFDNLKSAFEEDKNGWEQLMAVISFVVTLFETVATVMEVVNTIQDIFNIKKALGNKELAQEASLHGTIAGEQAAETGTTAALAGTQTAAAVATLALAKATKLLAATQIFAAHAYIPFVGASLAAAQVEIMEGVLASIAAFSRGGVVGGNSFSGDNILARVNSGERILTAKQNENLEKIANMNMISTPQLQTIRVEGVVRGKDILLVQKNYNSIGKKSGQNIFIN